MDDENKRLEATFSVADNTFKLANPFQHDYPAFRDFFPKIGCRS